MATRYAQYSQAEDVPEAQDIDRVFIGVRELNPGEIAPGYVTKARNMRFTNGEATPRLGVAKLPWTNRLTSQSPHTQPFARVYGAAEFNESLGVSWLIIAADGKVFRCQQYTAAAEVPLPPGVSITSDVSFTQTRSGLVMWRGWDDPLIMPSLETGFTTMVMQPNITETVGNENDLDGTLTIPPADRGDWIGNRLFFPFVTDTELDLVGISDYGNATRYRGIRDQGRINQGSSDRLLRIVQLVDNVAVCFKEASIYVLSNVKYDLQEMRLDTLAEKYGLCSPKAVANTGKDLWFLSPKRGVCSVALTEQNKIQGVDLPKSWTIQDTIDRINWGIAARTATATYFNNRFYLAVPLDDGIHAGINQVPESTQYDAGTGRYVINVEIGKSYRWVRGANDTGLINGLQTLTESDDFTAVGTEVELEGTEGATVTAEFRRVWNGVNNGVIVYDFVTQEWAGCDDGSAFCVKEWVTATFNGVKRQMFVGEDGFINCIEELFYDETAHWALSETDELATITPSSSLIDVPVEPGMCYRWTPDDNWSRLSNGGDIYEQLADFCASSNTVRIENIFGETDPIDAKLQAHVWLPVVEYVDQDWTSRGYGGDTIGRKKWSDLEIHLSTWFPEYQILASSEGYLEEIQIEPSDGWRTKSTTIYDEPWDRTPWHAGNRLDDHQTPGRQDYSVVLGETQIISGQIRAGVKYFLESQDVTSACSISYNGITVTNQTFFTGVSGVTTFTVLSGSPVVYPPGSYIELGINGIAIDQHQESVVPLRIPSAVRGRLVKIRVRCRQGRMIVRGIGPRGTFTTRSKGART